MYKKYFQTYFNDKQHEISVHWADLNAVFKADCDNTSVFLTAIEFFDNIQENEDAAIKFAENYQLTDPIAIPFLYQEHNIGYVVIGWIFQC